MAATVEEALAFAPEQDGYEHRGFRDVRRPLAHQIAKASKAVTTMEKIDADLGTADVPVVKMPPEPTP